MIFPPFWILKVADRNGKDNYASRGKKYWKCSRSNRRWKKKEKKWFSRDYYYTVETERVQCVTTKIARGWLRSSLNARLLKMGSNSASEITEARRGGEGRGSALSSCGFIKIQFSVRLTSGIIKHSGVEMMRPETCPHFNAQHVTLHSASNMIRNLFDFSRERYARD